MDTLPQLSDEEFDRIEDAIARTARGRAFLRRYHRRAMGGAGEEIRRMLTEFRVSWHRQSEAAEAAKHVDVLRRELTEMAASIETARREVAALRPPDGANDKILSATNELDAIVLSTERASFEILNSAESLMSVASRLRAEGANADLCAQIEVEISNIFTACSFQDLTGQRTSKVVNALRYIEQRINAMISVFGEDILAEIKIQHENTDKRPDAHLLNGPQLDGQGVSQNDVDSMFDTIPAAAGPITPPISGAESPSATPEKVNQAGIDSLFDSPSPAPAPLPAKANQADVDSLFDSPSPAPAAAPAKVNQAEVDSLFDSPAPVPAPLPAKVNQADVDSLFDSPAPVPAPLPAKVNQAEVDSLFDSPAPAPAPLPAKVNQADVDSLFDSPSPAPAAAPPKADAADAKEAPAPAPKPKPKPKPAPPKAEAKPAPAKPAPAPAPAPAAGAAPTPLDQSAIDSLFG